MTNGLLIVLACFTNYIDGPVDSQRGDTKTRTNYVTTVYAVPIPKIGWVTNEVTLTNTTTLELKWVPQEKGK